MSLGISALRWVELSNIELTEGAIHGNPVSGHHLKPPMVL